MKSGSVVGIDFGAAFGHATSSLPVPELTPFRLTRQFTSVLAPLDSTGHMRAHMCTTLAALRASGAREVLLNAMDVFLNEPIVDWAGGVTRSRETRSSAISTDESAADDKSMDTTDLDDVEAVISASDEQHMQESRRKLDNTKLKFYGANPTVIFEDDLLNNAWVKNLKSSDDWIRVVRGSVDAGNVRAKPEYIAAAASSSSSDSSSRRASSSSSKGSGGAPVQLSVAAQVDCLIDLATDANVMGRAFHGLSLWI
eukprot:11280-Heterococcus_DN1.PRE.1